MIFSSGRLNGGCPPFSTSQGPAMGDRILRGEKPGDLPVQLPREPQDRHGDRLDEAKAAFRAAWEAAASPIGVR
jgi:hypothetical protein